MDAALDSDGLLQHAAHVRALARRVVFDAELAEDVEQETWLAALAHAPRGVRDPARLAGFRGAPCRAQAERAPCAAQRARAPSRQRRRARFDCERSVGLVEREEAVRVLLAACAPCPSPCGVRSCSTYLDGLTLADVARAARARPLETVRSRVKRGLELLRSELARKRGARGGPFPRPALDLAPPALVRGAYWSRARPRSR
jgi:DNA-directed RNA polymerase specialized sigma24 family protein